MSADVKQQQYNAEQIQVLEGLEPVRKRPGMYIGSTGPRGLHHLVYEVVDNSVDEALAGYCTTINITIQKDNSIMVEDDGRGMPVDKHPKLGIPAVEVIHIDAHRGRIQIAYIDAEDGSPVLDIKPYTPSLDRIDNPGLPDWCSHWPHCVEDSADFNWEDEFNF